MAVAITSFFMLSAEDRGIEKLLCIATFHSVTFFSDLLGKTTKSERFHHKRSTIIFSIIGCDNSLETPLNIL